MNDSSAALRIDPAKAQVRTASLMSRAQAEIPLFHLRALTPATVLSQRAQAEGCSVTAALLPQIAGWLAAHPLLNGHWIDAEFRPAEHVDLGIAVSHRENVLIVVTLKDCATWSCSDFAAALAGIRERNLANAFHQRDFVRPSFSVSNLGGFGAQDFTSLVTPPQVGVLSVAAIANQPTVEDHEVVVRPMLPLTLGLDHRAVDGAYGAKALSTLTRQVSS
jgi:pyruvate dehydrogenase E2 component (dihydrolipoamide acetyltransferase)